MSHHKVTTTITKVVAGGKETRNFGDSSFVRAIAPQDGFIIKTETGGVTHTCFVTVDDFEAAKKLKSGEEILAASWDAKPTQAAIEAATPPKLPEK